MKRVYEKGRPAEVDVEVEVEVEVERIILPVLDDTVIPYIMPFSLPARGSKEKVLAVAWHDVVTKPSDETRMRLDGTGWSKVRAVKRTTIATAFDSKVPYTLRHCVLRVHSFISFVSFVLF